MEHENMKKFSETINRRGFLKNSATAVTTAALASVPTISTKIAAQTDAFRLEEATIAQIQSMFRQGEITSSRLVEMYRARITAVDGKLRSVIELNPDAQEIASRLDSESRAGKSRGSLHGIPVLLKDNIETGDKMITSAGSLALLENFAKQDSFLARKLREAGAIILGKTNLSEWANFRSTKSSSGWSGRGGQTKNPYALERNPCGSSSGTGAAIAASLATIGIGTETDGSIVCPSNACGLVGIKPTVGLVSRSGIIPISHTQDTAGPMTRTVTDAAILLGVIAGVDASDSATRGAKIPVGGYEQFLKTDLTGKRIGIGKQFFGKNAAVDKIIEATFPLLEKAGAKLVDIKIPTLGKFDGDEYEVLLYEFKADLNKYLSTATTRHKSLAQLIEFNIQNADKEMPHFGQEPGISLTTSGCIGQVYSVLVSAAPMSRGSSAMPHLGQAPPPCWRTSGSIGQV